LKFRFCFFLVNDENVSARDLLLLCSTPNEQQIWIQKIRKYIPKKMPAMNHHNGTNNSSNSTANGNGHRRHHHSTASQKSLNQT
jgi:hypothetical protein